MRARGDLLGLCFVLYIVMGYVLQSGETVHERVPYYYYFKGEEKQRSEENGVKIRHTAVFYPISQWSPLLKLDA